MEKIRDLQMASGKYIKTKVAEYQRLYSKWLWLVTVVYKPSFPDAEILENIGEDFVGSDFSGDFSEVMHGFAYVLRE